MKAVMILIVTVLAVAMKRECDLFRDGDYKLTYTLHPSSINFKIENERFYIYYNTDTIKGDFKEINKCLFMLRYDHEGKNKYDRLRIKTEGYHCLEVQKVSGDTIFFRATQSRKLEVTTNEGYFLKQK